MTRLAFVAFAIAFLESDPQSYATDSRRGAEVLIGERLFSEGRFSQGFFAAKGAAGAHSAGPAGSGLFSCEACHFRGQGSDPRNRASEPARAFCDFAPRSSIPPRGDGHATTPRNSPTLVEALGTAGQATLLHYDGEFASAEDLVKESFAGRNFGWLPTERAAARRHFARVIREDRGGDPAAAGGGFSYAQLLGGKDSALPPELRVGEAYRLEVSRATDDEILDGCARLVVAFLRSLRFSRDEAGQHNGSPYDAFLGANGLPRAPAAGQTPHEYARQLGEAVAAMRAPRFVDDEKRRLVVHDQPFRFGETELRGLRIFFRGAVGNAQTSGAGNCAECHVPPHFTDFSLHNTGEAQAEYDAIHGSGRFAKLAVPTLAERSREHDRWLPATAEHPNGRGSYLLPAAREEPNQTDLGLWNVYGNPDLPKPQRAIEHLLNYDGRLSRDDVLASTLARFKTPTVRDPGQSAPYLHTGRLRTLEEVIAFYQQMSALAHEGRLRNGPPQFFAVRLGPADVAPLAAFLRSLNEDFR